MANADTVILKSGELFQTRQSWKENGIVSFVQHGRVRSVKESEVERLIHSSSRAEAKSRSHPSMAADAPEQPENASIPFTPIVSVSDEDTAGYLDLKWGIPLSQVDGLEHAGTDPAYGGVALYTLKNRERFGRAHIDRILLGFWQDKLYTITVWSSNFIDFRDLKAEAFRRFGEGAQNREDVEKFHWAGETTDRLLFYDDDWDSGYLWMRSGRVHAMVKARYPD